MINLNEFTKYTFVDKNGTSLPYRLYDPNLGSGRPLLVFLHGAGERGDDNELTLNSVSPFAANYSLDFEKYGAYILVPQCATDHQWVDTPWVNGSFDRSKVKISIHLSAAKELIDETVEKYSIDRNRIYIMGCSMGGFGTWDMISRFPDYFRAAMPICGSSDPNDIDKIKHIPIWTFHGDADPSVPVSGTREAYTALKAVGGDVIYSEYKGCGHGVWELAYKNECIFDWLFSR